MNVLPSLRLFKGETVEKHTFNQMGTGVLYLEWLQGDPLSGVMCYQLGQSGGIRCSVHCPRNNKVWCLCHPVSAIIVLFTPSRLQRYGSSSRGCHFLSHQTLNGGRAAVIQVFYEIRKSERFFECFCFETFYYFACFISGS